jgi:uncharacterized membrane protein YdjX (TVP38/TMEM64 family)
MFDLPKPHIKSWDRAMVDRQMGEADSVATGAAEVQGTLKRFLPLIVMAVAAAIVIGNGWHKHLTIENVVGLRDRFQGFVSQNFLVAILSYIAVYATAVGLSVPGASVLTLAGGLMFGLAFGGLAAVTGATIGATIIFLVARTAFGETLAAKGGAAVETLRAGFKDNALSYLLFLRLVPAFPFFLVNLVPALAGVPLKTYVIGTFFGIIPGTFAFASIGSGLDSIVSAAKSEQAACIASKGAAACPFKLSVGQLVTKEMLIAFTLLGLVALIPVVAKKWTRRNG